MGVEYHLVSEQAESGYELGKGPWGSGDLARALRSADPVGQVAGLMTEYGFEADYAVKTACEVAAFAAMHPDWRVVDDGSWQRCR